MGEESRSLNSTIYEQYVRDINTYPLITVEEEKELAERIEAGDKEALNTLVQANLRLVIHIVNRSYLHFGVPPLDLISEGNIGLCIAAKRFRPKNFKAKFSTYASFWVRQKIQRHINEVTGAMRVPVHVWEKMRKVKKFIAEYTSENGESPSDEDIAFATGFSLTNVRKWLQGLKEPISLNASLTEDGDTTFESVVEDPNAAAPNDATVGNEELVVLETVVNQLDERSRDVLIRRYGLFNHKIETLEEIGATYKITRERIRQIEAKAIKRLRFLMRRLNRDERLRTVML